MSFISAGNTTTTTLLINGDTTGNLVFNTGGANTTALTISNTQAATFANNVTITGTTTHTGNAAFSNITSTGSIGAGTTTPAQMLSVGSTSNRGNVQVLSTDGNGISIQTGGGGPGSGAAISFYDADTNYAAKMSTSKISTNSASLVFSTANGSAAFTEGARLDAAGFKIGTTADDPVASRVPGTAIRISGSTNGSIYSRGGNWELGLTAASGTHIFFYTDNGSANQSAGQITSSNNTTTYGTGSDYRLKDSIQPMVGALNKVLQLNPVTFKWKANGSDGQGFIAHELQAIVPDCVLGEKDGVDENGKPIYQNIDTSFLVATLAKAIQELNAKVDAQAAEIAALKAGA